MLITLLTRLTGAIHHRTRTVRARILAWTTPAASGQVLGTLADLARAKSELVAENALLRQQLIVLRRSVKRPNLTRADRVLLLLLASRVRAWRLALLIVKPDTLLRWHRQGFRLFWRHKSNVTTHTPRVPVESIALIAEMAVHNRLWGAERIRGELVKLGIRLSKRTIQKYLRRARPPQPRGQKWSTFLRNHAPGIWACDFVAVSELFFRPIYAFVLIQLAARRLVHVGAPRHPCDAGVAALSGIEVLRSPYRAPLVNAICERFLGSLRRVCLDHRSILNQRHLPRVLSAFVAFHNGARSHQGIGQGLPAGAATLALAQDAGHIIAVSVLGGLHHNFRRTA